MAYSLLRGCHRYDIKGAVGVTPNPASWHSLADICQDFAKCLTSTGGYGRRVLIHVFLPGTRISLDIGDVKAAGYLCVLGISLGIGSYVLYKIYDEYIKPVFWPRGSVSSDGEETDEEDTNLEADERIMGNEQSTVADVPVYYRPGYGVSLYKPVEKLHVPATDGYGLRNRKLGSNNGEVLTRVSPTEEILYSDDGSISDQPDVPHRNHARDFRDLRIEIDESGFIEDENDVNPPSLSNSLKGNFSPRSLYEKTRQYNSSTSVNDSDDECTCLNGKGNKGTELESEKLLNENSKLKCDNSFESGKTYKNIKENEIKENDKAKSNFDNLTPNSNLESSSVLLTPPPEDEISSAQPFSTSSARYSLHSTKSDISDIHSEVADAYDKVFDDHDEKLYNHDANDGGALTDEDQENLSPLPFDNSTEKYYEKRLQVKALISKLNELKSRTRSSSESSPTKTSTSDSFPYLEHRRVTSLGGSKDTTFSGVSSPELELLKTETEQTSVVTSGTFDNLEDEIQDVEDEFVTITSQLQELTNKCENCDTCSNAGLEILDSIYRRYPSIRVRHKDKGIQNINFRISSYTDPDANQDSDVETDGAELSWDLENVLDMLYSETSESGSMQNPVVKKLSKEHRKMRSESNSPVDFLEKNSFDSSVELDGSLYEDDFHLQLGTQPSSLNSVESQLSGGSMACQQKQEETSLEVEATSHTPGEITSQLEEPACQEREPAKSCSNLICNIGTKVSLTEYAEREWRGNTPRADLMKKAYAEIPRHCQYCHLRQIRGDNYCAIRGTVFQCLVNNLPPFSLSSKDCVLQELSQAFSDPSSGLSHWTFANRLSYTNDNKWDVMRKCIDSLHTRFEELQQIKLYSERDQITTDLLNSDSQRDIELMEGVKLLMLLNAWNLHKDMSQGNEVPIFMWLMFARDSSETMELFVKNHLNPVGDSGGLEQVEMFLLGYSLGVRIQVFRLSQFGDSDFISYYPDDSSDKCQTVTLLAEDDRHYNVPVL